MSSELREPTLEYLKREFRARWPDAEKAIKKGRDPHHSQAAALWLGFKEGYALAMVQPHE